MVQKNSKQAHLCFENSFETHSANRSMFVSNRWDNSGSVGTGRIVALYPTLNEKLQNTSFK